MIDSQFPDKNMLVVSKSPENSLSSKVIPMAIVLEKFINIKLEELVSLSDKINIDDHIASLEKKGIRFDDITSSIKLRRIIEWASEAADTSDKNNKEMASAWRAVLESIMTEDDYTIIDAVKRLNADDVKIIVNMLDEDLYDDNMGDKLRSIGIVKKEILKNPTVKRNINISLNLIVITGVLFALSELNSYFGREVEVALKPVLQLSKWSFLFLFMIYSFSMTLRHINLFVSYSLTDYGRRLSGKVKKYMNDIPPEA